MKKLILTIAIAVAATLGANAQITFGGQAGVNLATLKSESTQGNTTTTEKGKTKVGFLVGVVANIPFSTALSFRPELNFIQKGGKFNSTYSPFPGATTTDNDNIVMNFIELPLNIVYSMPAGPGHFLVGAGPNISFGLSGKDKFTSMTSGGGFPSQSSSGSTKVKFDGKKYADLPQNDNDLHFKAVDFGANLLVGYKMNMGVFFNAGYTFGFSNLNPNPNTSLKTGGFTLKVGYMFGGNNGSSSE